MRGLRFIVLFLLPVLCMASACRISKKASQPKQEQTSLNDKERLDFSFLFYEAIKDKILGNLKPAQIKLQQAIRIDPRNDAAHYELSQVYQMSGNADLARMDGELAVKFNPKNLWYKRSLADIYASTGEFAKQIGMLQEIAKSESNNTEALYELGEAYIHARKYEEALKIYEQIEKTEGISEELIIQKKNLYLQMRKPAKAIEEISKLVETNPDESSYRGMLAEIFLFDNKPEKAFEQYQEILKRDPQNPNVHFSLADFYRKQDDNAKSFDELKQAFANPDGAIGIKIQVISSYFEISSDFPELKTQAYELCSELIRTHPEDARAYSIYGDFLFRDERYNEALEQYQHAINLDKSRFSTWNQLLLTLNELGDTRKLNDLSTEAAELFPQQPILFLYKGLSFMQLKQYNEAVESLKEGLIVTVENKALSVQFLASLGDSYHHLQRYEESDEAYEAALKVDPANIYVLNNYAYYLSVRNTKLDRATELARKCNELAPGKPSYEDTYAWVLFRAGKTEEALVWIEKAIASGGNTNSTILDHQGDIRWTLNKKNEAIESWKKSIELGGDSGKLDKKIREGLPK